MPDAWLKAALTVSPMTKMRTMRKLGSGTRSCLYQKRSRRWQGTRSDRCSNERNTYQTHKVNKTIEYQKQKYSPSSM